MKRFVGVLISLPVLAAPWVTTLSATSANAAAAVGPVDALRILAHSKAVNLKCGHEPSVQEELNTYVAKAEVSVARVSGSDAASAAVTDGTREGKSMKCGSASEELVRAALDAARRAMAQATGKPVKRKIVRQGPVNLRLRHAGDQALNAAAQPEAAPKRRVVEVAPSGALKKYSRLAAAYYIEHRCRHMSHNQAYRFWQIVARTHNKLLESHGPEQVARAKSEAQVMAKSGYRGGCGTNTKRIVKERYARIASR